VICQTNENKELAKIQKTNENSKWLIVSVKEHLVKIYYIRGMIGGATHHMVAPQIEQCHTINRGAWPHIEANISSCAKYPTIPILRVLDRSEGCHNPSSSLTSMTTSTAIPGQCRYWPQGRTDLLWRQQHQVAATAALTTMPMAEDLALGHGNVKFRL
jgi:hypothetical protein